MGIGLGLLGAVTPYFTGRLFDTAIPQADRGLLWQFVIGLLVAALISTAFKVTQAIAVLRVQGKMDYGIQAALWDRLFNLPSNALRQYSAGDLADRAAGVDRIRQLVAGAGINSGLFEFDLLRLSHG
ncbi:MAG: ABC transporter transmembrane domain-containing protein [Thermoanaerobaculaceae bacterium]